MHESLDVLARCAQELGDEQTAKQVVNIGEWLDRTECHIVVCGEFKRGKSTLVNALLRSDICPVDVLPATAVPTVFEYAQSPSAWIEFNDGRREVIDPSRKGLSQLSIGESDIIDSIRMVSVQWPCALLNESFVLVDTPGVNDLSKQRSDVSYGFLPLADVAIVVLDSTAPVTLSEMKFLSEQVLPNVLDRLIFVLGKCDRLDEDEAVDALSSARLRLAKIISSPVNIIPLSGLMACRGEHERLDDLITELKKVRDGSTMERARLTGYRLLNVSQDLLDEADRRLQILDVPRDEITEAQSSFDETRLALASKYETFDDHIDLYGRKILKELVCESILKLCTDMEMDLLHRMELLDGKIEEFTTREVPYSITLAIRRWSESKGKEIDVFLSKLVNRIAIDYATEFAVPIELSGLPKSLQTPEFLVASRAGSKSNVEEILKTHLLPTAVPMVAGYLLLGPLGVIAGSLIGQMAGVKLREEKLDAQKREATSLVKTELRSAFDTFTRSVNSEVDAWFDKLREMLRQGVLDRVKSAERVLSTSSESLDSISAIKKRIEAVIPIIKEAISHE